MAMGNLKLDLAFHNGAQQVLAPSLVVALLGGGRPPAIARRVVAVIVDAIQAPVSWALPHIVIEVLERMPAFANTDSSCSVIDVIRAIWIVAALNHCDPNVVNLGPG